MIDTNLPIEGPGVWVATDVRPHEYWIELSAGSLDEIRKAVDEIRAYPLPTILRAPDDVGLLCLRQAQSGGHSRVVSFSTVHNRLFAQYRHHLPRLYAPFWFDRQREYRPGESAIFAAPVFENTGDLKARFSVHQIIGGYAMKGEPIDSEGEAAIAGATGLFDDDGVSVD